MGPALQGARRLLGFVLREDGSLVDLTWLDDVVLPGLGVHGTRSAANVRFGASSSTICHSSIGGRPSTSRVRCPRSVAASLSVSSATCSSGDACQRRPSPP